VQRDAALADQRALLEEEKDKLSSQLADLGFGDSGSLAFDQNFADSSQVTAERAEVEALATSLQERLAEVREALDKMDAGTYGMCESCGQPIAPARLEAQPAARQCIDCASRR
jgi:RNA polymerase-binding transcription factor DksA